MNFIYKHRNKLFIIASILLLIPFLFNIGLGEDEPFTMGIIRHNYSEIINLTTMDVHPPLYYFILKAFLTITTFWTTNIFIKIIFARLLSIIFSAISFIYLLKILNLLNIRYNKYANLFLFMILPLNLGIVNQLAHIRMYSLGLCLGTAELYYLLRALNHSQRTNYIAIVLLATLSLYNNFYLSISNGLFIIVFLVYFIRLKEYKKFLYLSVCGLFSLILFIPWIPHLLVQSNTTVATLDLKRIVMTILDYVSSIIIFLPLIFIKIKDYKTDCIKLFILSNFVITLMILVINVIINPAVTSIRYMITPLIINLVISLDIYLFSSNFKNNCYKSIITIISLILALGLMDSLYKQVKLYDIPSISFVRKINKIKNNPDKNIDTQKYGLEGYQWQFQSGNAIYLQYLNKNVTDNNYHVNGSVSSNALYKKVFYNVKHFTPFKK